MVLYFRTQQRSPAARGAPLHSRYPRLWAGDQGFPPSHSFELRSFFLRQPVSGLPIAALLRLRWCGRPCWEIRRHPVQLFFRPEGGLEYWQIAETCGPGELLIMLERRGAFVVDIDKVDDAGGGVGARERGIVVECRGGQRWTMHGGQLRLQRKYLSKHRNCNQRAERAS